LQPAKPMTSSPAFGRSKVRAIRLELLLVKNAKQCFVKRPYFQLHLQEHITAFSA